MQLLKTIPFALIAMGLDMRNTPVSAEKGRLLIIFENNHLYINEKPNLTIIINGKLSTWAAHLHGNVKIIPMIITSVGFAEKNEIPNLKYHVIPHFFLKADRGGFFVKIANSKSV